MRRTPFSLRPALVLAAPILALASAGCGGEPLEGPGEATAAGEGAAAGPTTVAEAVQVEEVETGIPSWFVALGDVDIVADNATVEMEPMSELPGRLQLQLSLRSDPTRPQATAMVVVRNLPRDLEERSYTLHAPADDPNPRTVYGHFATHGTRAGTLREFSDDLVGRLEITRRDGDRLWGRVVLSATEIQVEPPDAPPSEGDDGEPWRPPVPEPRLPPSADERARVEVRGVFAARLPAAQEPPVAEAGERAGAAGGTASTGEGDTAAARAEEAGTVGDPPARVSRLAEPGG